jgi:hypothetical protein
VLAANALVAIKPSTSVEVRLEPRVSAESNPGQYVARRTVEGEDVYLFGRLERRTVSLTTRLDYALRRDLSFQVYAQPFVSAGSYDRFGRVAEPGAGRFRERFTPLPVLLDSANNRYTADLDGGGPDLAFGRPDFNFKQLRSTAVLRWEYRPGSTLFAVWNRGQSARDPHGRFDLFGDLGDLFAAEARDTVIVKVAYWFGL